MAVETRCQTPGARFHTAIVGQQITVSIDLPHPLGLTWDQAAMLDDNLHNALELVLARYFPEVI